VRVTILGKSARLGRMYDGMAEMGGGVCPGCLSTGAGNMRRSGEVEYIECGRRRRGRVC